MVQVVEAVRMISLDDMHSENIWFTWCKSSNYRGKLRCHAYDGGGRMDGKWKIGQCSVGPETAIKSLIGTCKPKVRVRECAEKTKS